uniref:ShKT domain-containing protein n=1 Tax=Steinernema glaseri TaxID=37863 RepID=A0A1I8AQQ3_9BILA
MCHQSIQNDSLGKVKREDISFYLNGKGNTFQVRAISDQNQDTLFPKTTKKGIQRDSAVVLTAPMRTTTVVLLLGLVSFVTDAQTSCSGCCDRYAECPNWASTGLCNINPNWTLTSCPLSCGVCHNFWRTLYFALAGNVIFLALSWEDPIPSKKGLQRDSAVVLSLLRCERLRLFYCSGLLPSSLMLICCARDVVIDTQDASIGPAPDFAERIQTG